MEKVCRRRPRLEGKRGLSGLKSRIPTGVSRYAAVYLRNVGGVSDNGGEVMRYDAGNPRNVGVGAPNGGGVSGNGGEVMPNGGGVSPNGGDVSRYAAGVGRQFLPGGGGKALPPEIAPGARRCPQGHVLDCCSNFSPAAAGWEEE